MSTATAPASGTDFKGYKPSSTLLVWSVDEKARASVTEVEVVKILGDHLIVKHLGAPKEAQTMTFSRKAGTKAGDNGFPYIPNSQARLMHPDEDGKKLLAAFKAGKIKPLLSEDDLCLRKAVEWLRTAEYADVVKITDITKLIEHAREAGAV